MRNILYIILLIITLHHKAAANNLQLYETKVIDAAHIRFKISWENSWNLRVTEPPYNHDAIWVFVKFRKNGGSWQHADIKAAKLAFDTSQLIINTATDKKGIFIQRKNPGAGKIELTEIETELANSFETGIYDVQVFGIEMVWVEEEAFFIGDGVSYNSFSRGDARSALKINSEAEIATGNNARNIFDTSQYAPTGPIPEHYPKGYKGFYCMKYEISQQQYAEFLNSLTYNQQKVRTYILPEAAPGTLAMTTSIVNRNGLIIEKSGIKNSEPAVYGFNVTKDNIFNNENDGQNRACNFLSWADITAYLDWSALRPMTEFEFEKVCRGPLTSVPREFAWGTAKVTDANNVLKDGTADETVKENLLPGSGLASHGYMGLQGPLRSGFAGADTTDRLSIGAAYYGALEMSGNLIEQCITVNQKALQFDGKNGDGEITAEGEANVINWPLKDGDGAGYRGGGWLSGIQAEFRDLAVSDRFYAGLKPNTRRATAGGRGVRYK